MSFFLLRALPPQSRKTIGCSCSFSFSIIWSVKVVQPRFLWLFACPRRTVRVVVSKGTPPAAPWVGVAGVGGGATFASLIVLGTMGLPIEIVGLLASVEPLIDMGRTALNVSDSMVAGVTASNAVGALDRSVLRDPEARVSSDGHAGL